MSDFKKIRAVVITLVLVPVLGALFVTKVDQTPYDQTEFYRTTLARKDSLINQLQMQGQMQTQGQAQGQLQTQIEEQTQTHTPADAQGAMAGPPAIAGRRTGMHTQTGLQAGWGLASITPPRPVRLTGMNFKPYQQVFDSVYVRTFLFDNSINRVLLVSYDLWIMHPVLAEAVKEMIGMEFPDIKGIYFTANHSHTSIGGWASGLLGELVVGGNNSETVDFIVGQTHKSILLAVEKLEAVGVGFGAIATKGLVTNRLDKNGSTDHLLRALKLVNTEGKIALFNTYSAHSVYMNKDINTLSADYPGPYLEFLQEHTELDFASFAPGATGSHTPVGRKPFEHAKMLGYARELAQYAYDLQGQIKTNNTGTLKFLEWPVDLRSAHFRISNYWRLRPWIFNTVMGTSKANITVLRIGDTVLVGLPVELSGEYYQELEEVGRQYGLSLMITSFNGWYLGYVNPEKYYFTLKRSETREMNWFGYQNGEYFVELIKHVLEMV